MNKSLAFGADERCLPCLALERHDHRNDLHSHTEDSDVLTPSVNDVVPLVGQIEGQVCGTEIGSKLPCQPSLPHEVRHGPSRLPMLIVKQECFADLGNWLG